MGEPEDDVVLGGGEEHLSWEYHRYSGELYLLTGGKLDSLEEKSGDENIYGSLFSACLSSFVTLIIVICSRPNLLTGDVSLRGAIILGLAMASGLCTVVFGVFWWRKREARKDAREQLKSTDPDKLKSKLSAFDGE